MKKRVINLEPYDVRIDVYSGRFVLTFHGRSQNNKSQIIIKLRFKFWWIASIARKLWEAIQIQRRELNYNIDRMKGDD